MSYPYVQILKETIIFCEKKDQALFLYVALAGLELTVEQADLELTEILLLLPSEWLPTANKAPLSRALMKSSELIGRDVHLWWVTFFTSLTALKNVPVVVLQLLIQSNSFLRVSQG